ncbi:hypothetical protein UlMin_036768, partial [Ulmus minor]
MASLLHSPSSSSLVSRVSRNLHPLPNHSGSPLVCPARLRNGVMCNLVEPLKYENGKPRATMPNGVPDMLAPRMHLENIVNKHDTRLRIFSGTANPALSQEIACYMGLELGKIKIKHFADGEIYVQLQESVRGCDVMKTQGRESIAAKLVANLITEAGANRVLACDLHSGQSMGYFDIPVDHVYGQPVILNYLASKTICSDDLVVVSPDVGG